MAKGKHGGKVSRRNRETARSIKDDKGRQMFKGTKQARDAGLNLPTRDEIENQETDATRPRVPAYRPKKNG